MKVSDIDWEIQQLWMAIDYYEKGVESTFSRREAEDFKQTIADLNGKIKKLERERDEKDYSY